MERERVRDTRYFRQEVALSPRMLRSITYKCQRPELIKSLEALKPGAMEIEDGFLPVQLEAVYEGEPLSLHDMKPIGSGKAGSAYVVRLANEFERAGEKCGRDFVFKAMLCTDPDNMMPGRLKHLLVQGTDVPKELVSLEKASTYKEYQMAASLDAGSCVIRAYGLVQMNDVFGILLEKIEGITVRDLIVHASAALKQSKITASEYLDLARQLMADVLIAVSCCEDANAKGFVVLAKRGVVERTHAWTEH